MDPATVEAIIEAAMSHWPTAGPVEITLEANPNSVEAAPQMMQIDSVPSRACDVT